MPEPLAYGVTRLLFEGRDELAKAHQAAARLNIRSAISTPPLPLHPGACATTRHPARKSLSPAQAGPQLGARPARQPQAGVQAARLVGEQVEPAGRRLDEDRDDRQAEAAAVDVLRAGRPPEPLGGQLTLLLGEPRTGVDHVDGDAAPSAAGRIMTVLPSAENFDGVVDEGVERLVERGRHGAGLQRVRRADVAQRDVLLRGDRLPRDDPRPRDLAGVDVGELEAAPLGAGQGEKAVQDLAEAFDLLEGQAVPLDGLRVGEVDAEVLDPQPHRGERVAQLVAGVGDERALPLQRVRRPWRPSR